MSVSSFTESCLVDTGMQVCMRDTISGIGGLCQESLHRVAHYYFLQIDSLPLIQMDVNKCVA